MDFGKLRHRLTLENPGGAVPDGGGGYTEAWTSLSPSQMWASIVPATAKDLERVVANTVQSTASHIITMRFHDGLTMKTRLTKGPRNADGTLASGSREFRVTGIQNPEEQDEQLILACVETVA